MPNPRKTQKLLSLFFIFLLLLNFPLISIVNRPVLVAGIPLLYVYVFCVWALLIALMAFIVRKQGNKNRHE